MMLMSLFGPFSECHLNCKEVITMGYFHGELTSEGCKAVMGPNPEPGSFLLRLRKGTRSQLALAVAENGTICHTLIDCEKGRFNIRQTVASFPTVTKLIDSLKSMCKKPIVSNIMNSYGPNLQVFPLIDQRVTYPPQFFDISKATPTQKTTLDELVVAKKELQMAQNEFVFSVESPLIELVSVKEGSEPAPQSLKNHVQKCTESAIITVEIPSLQARRKMKVQMTITGKDALQRFLHKVPLANMEKIGLYLPKGSIWIDLSRQLSNYLIEPDSVIQVKDRPDANSAKTLLVHNRATGAEERIIYDDDTTVLGLIQACGKLIIPRIPSSGIRLFAGTPFFAVISKKLSEYKIGTEITQVEYDDAGQDALFVTPDCIPALRSKLSLYSEMTKNITTLNDKVCIVACKLTGALPPMNTALAPGLARKAGAMGLGPHGRPQTRMIKPGTYTLNNTPPPSHGPVVVKPLLPSMPAPTPAVSSVESEYAKLAEGLPPMELELQDTMKWISELVFLAVWWDSIDDSERSSSKIIQEAKDNVKHLFGPLCTNKTSRTVLIQNGALTPKQIISVVKCLNHVAQFSTN